MANDWNALIERAKGRLSDLESERESAVGQLADAAIGVRQDVLAEFDRRIAEQRSQIENFEWARDHNMG